MNKKQQSAIGVSRATLYFSEQGYPVFVPVTDCSRYDLVVDIDGILKRVEVKTVNSKTDAVELRTLGGNQSWSGEVKRISECDCDIVFMYNIRTQGYKVMTSEELAGRRSIRVR